MKHHRSVFALALLGFAGLRTAAADGPRYVGELIDGTKITGNELKSVQDAPSAWKLDEVSLFGENPLRWLKDRTLLTAAAPASFIEFRNGDVLPGELSRYYASSPLGDFSLPHFVFTTSVGSDLPEASVRPFERRRMPGPATHPVRLDPVQARRIVWQRRASDTFTPKTLYYRDGRSVEYRSLRWEETAVKILGEQGPATVPFDEIAELHLDASDPWADYARQLAVLMPELHGRLAQFETEDGARITSTTDRFQMPAVYTGIVTVVNGGGRKIANLAFQVVQPSWAYDAITLDMGRIRARRYFGPHEVPLSAVAPAAIVQSTGLARSWRPLADRSVQGGPLINGGAEFGWGWGVHAYNRLEFDLPPFARAFQTKIGLDQVAGAGGCAKGVVLFKSGGEQTLFASPVLIGSKETAGSGPLELPDAGKKDRKLILLADPLLKAYPAGADPLEIGDMLDWLEPLVTLDPQGLLEQVAIAKKGNVNPVNYDAVRELIQKVAPGFEPAQPDLKTQQSINNDGGVTFAPVLPHLLRRVTEIPAGKTTKLRISAEIRTPPSLIVNISVLANGIALGPAPGTFKPSAMVSSDVDLTQFAGRRIALEIDCLDQRRTMDPRVNIIHVKRIELVSTDPPAPKDDKKPDPGK